jgi:hypothetical protein
MTDEGSFTETKAKMIKCESKRALAEDFEKIEKLLTKTLY